MIKPHPVDNGHGPAVYGTRDREVICISHATAAEQCYITRVSPRGTTELKHTINVPADNNNCHAKHETLAQTDMRLFKFLENQ